MKGWLTSQLTVCVLALHSNAHVSRNHLKAREHGARRHACPLIAWECRGSG
jgi:hypothetical protein